MAIFTYRKISGNWTPLADWYGRASGAWRRANQAYRKVGGVWTEVFRRNYYVGTITVGSRTTVGGASSESTTGFRTGWTGSATFQAGDAYGSAQQLYERNTFNTTLQAYTAAPRTGWAIGTGQIPGVTQVRVIVTDMNEVVQAEATLTWQNDPRGALGNAYWVDGNPLGLGTALGIGTQSPKIITSSALGIGTQYKVYVQYLP